MEVAPAESPRTLVDTAHYNLLKCRPFDCSLKIVLEGLPACGSGSCRISKNFGGHSTLSKNNYGNSSVQLYMLETVGPHPSS